MLATAWRTIRGLRHRHRGEHCSRSRRDVPSFFRRLDRDWSFDNRNLFDRIRLLFALLVEERMDRVPDVRECSLEFAEGGASSSNFSLQKFSRLSKRLRDSCRGLSPL